MQTLLMLFFSSYFLVLLLGFQSQIVRDKHAITAFVTSLMIGTCQLVLFKLAPNASTLESIVFVLGGAFGITSSIYLHNFWLWIHSRKHSRYKHERYD